MVVTGDRRHRIAVVGVGMFGRLHALACRDHPAVRLVGVVDANAARGREVGAELSVSAYHDVDALLAGQDVDAVIVATPEDVRRGVAERCAAAGKAMLLEKPLAPTVLDCQGIVDAVRAAGVTAMVDFTLRVEPRYLAVKEALEAGRLGEVISIVAKRNGTVVGARTYGRWTGLLMSTAIHEIDLMRWYGGAVQRVGAEITYKSSPHEGVESAVAATFKFASGAIGLLETSWARPQGVPDRLDARCEVVGTAGAATVDLSSHGLRVTEAGATSFPDLTYWPVQRGRVGGTVRMALEHFVRCLDGDEAPAATVEDGREAVRLIEAIKEAGARGTTVAIQEGGAA